MGAKFYICMLLVVLVNSAVCSARLRRPQDKERTSNFLYERIFQDDTEHRICCMGSCNNCPSEGGPYESCPGDCDFGQDHAWCPSGEKCCCSSNY